VTLRTLHQAVCDRCGWAEPAHISSTPKGWYVTRHPSQPRLRLLCPSCVRLLEEFLDAEETA
jgi:hypothetical protein